MNLLPNRNGATRLLVRTQLSLSLLVASDGFLKKRVFSYYLKEEEEARANDCLLHTLLPLSSEIEREIGPLNC